MCIGLGEPPGTFLTRHPAEVAFMLTAASHAHRRQADAVRSLDGGI